MQNESDFWDNRVSYFGHTGWSDFNIYVFDQLARLKAIKQVLTLHHVTGKIAFDFGCGTGDFSNLLCDFFNNVYGYDISEKVISVAKEKYHKNKSIQFFTAMPLQKLPLVDNSVDLILCVTVLDHIKNDKKLNDTLFYFHKKLTKNGCVLLLEYAPGTAVAELNEYQRYDLHSTWRKRFCDFGFTITREYGFYQPNWTPTVSYKEYNANKMKNVWKALSHFQFSKRKMAAIAQKMVNKHNDFFYESTDKDWLKIMILSKTA